jgi:hypothetical protein
MSSYIVKEVVGSMLADGYQMKKVLQTMETIAQDSSLVEDLVRAIPSCLASGFGHHELERSVDCRTETQERRS